MNMTTEDGTLNKMEKMTERVRLVYGGEEETVRTLLEVSLATQMLIYETLLKILEGRRRPYSSMKLFKE